MENLVDAAPSETRPRVVKIMGLEGKESLAPGFYLLVTWEADKSTTDRTGMQPIFISDLSEVWVEESEEKFWLSHPGLDLFLDLPNKTGKAILSQPRSWQDVLRITHFHLLLERRGLLLHASGLVRGGRAYVFPGPSGAGKTTIVRHSPGMTLLSDEIVALGLAGGGAGVTALGTPFYGEWGQPGEQISTPLQGLYFPCQARENRLVPLDPRQVVSRLLPCICTYTVRQSRLEKIFALGIELAARVPGFDLHFRPEPGLWRAIDGP